MLPRARANEYIRQNTPIKITHSKIKEGHLLLIRALAGMHPAKICCNHSSVPGKRPWALNIYSLQFLANMPGSISYVCIEAAKVAP